MSKGSSGMRTAVHLSSLSDNPGALSSYAAQHPGQREGRPKFPGRGKAGPNSWAEARQTQILRKRKGRPNLGRKKSETQLAHRMTSATLLASCPFNVSYH